MVKKVGSDDDGGVERRRRWWFDGGSNGNCKFSSTGNSDSSPVHW